MSGEAVNSTIAAATPNPAGGESPPPVNANPATPPAALAAATVTSSGNGLFAGVRVSPKLLAALGAVATSVVTLLVAIAGGLGGCASIPPEAATHAAALADAHDATAHGALAALDAIGDGFMFALDRQRETTDGDWAATIADDRDAAARFEALAAGLDTLLASADAQTAARVGTVLAQARDSARASRDLFTGYAAQAETTRAADAQGLTAHETAARSSIRDLRALVQQNTSAVSAELRRQSALIASYVSVAAARDAALGPDAAQRLAQLSVSASGAAASAGDWVTRINAAIQILTAAGSTSTSAKPAAPAALPAQTTPVAPVTR